MAREAVLNEQRRELQHLQQQLLVLQQQRFRFCSTCRSKRTVSHLPFQEQIGAQFRLSFVHCIVRSRSHKRQTPQESSWKTSPLSISRALASVHSSQRSVQNLAGAHLHILRQIAGQRPRAFLLPARLFEHLVTDVEHIRPVVQLTLKMQ